MNVRLIKSWSSLCTSSITSLQGFLLYGYLFQVWRLYSTTSGTPEWEITPLCLLFPLFINLIHNTIFHYSGHLLSFVSRLIPSNLTTHLPLRHYNLSHQTHPDNPSTVIFVLDLYSCARSVYRPCQTVRLLWRLRYRDLVYNESYNLLIFSTVKVLTILLHLISTLLQSLSGSPGLVPPVRFSSLTSSRFYTECKFLSETGESPLIWRPRSHLLPLVSPLIML